MNGSEILTKGNWNASEVDVHVEGTFIPSERVQAHVDEMWSKMLEKFPAIFNGPLLRLCSWTVDSALHMEMEKTDFAAYLATREPSFETEFPGELRADPQGMNIVAITSDSKVIITRRSIHSEQNPGTLNFIGGYVDLPTDGSKNINLSDQAKRELEEELYILPEQVSQITVRGLGYDPNHCHPELFIVAQVSVHSDDILANWKRAKDAKEANAVMAMDKEELVARHLEKNLPFPTCWSFEIGMQLL